MNFDSYYIQAKKAVKERLFKLPGVCALGLGPKFVNGIPIGQVAIQVFVKRKKPIVELAENEIIPEFIGNIPVDVLEWGDVGNISSESSLNSCISGEIQAFKEIMEGEDVVALEIQSLNHNLFEGEIIRIVGEFPYSLAFPVMIIDENNFLIHIKENGRTAAIGDFNHEGNIKWMSVSTLDSLCCCQSGDIEFISASNVVNIVSSNHGLIKGDRVKIRKISRKLEPLVYTIDKIDNNTFRLNGANPADFSIYPGGWKWHKVSITLTGRITKIEIANPVIIHSKNHGLSNKDEIHIVSIETITKEYLDTAGKEMNPHKIQVEDSDRFSIPGLDATTWNNTNIERDFIGHWIKVSEDKNKYSILRGGIRVEVEEPPAKTRSVEPLTSPMSTTIKQNQVTVVEIKRSIGTLGCIAIDNVDNKKVLLSNAHVLDANKSNQEVHHPDYYESSKTCSSHKVAELSRKVFGVDPATQFTVDAAIATIKEKVVSDPIIVDIGKVKGTVVVSPEELKNGDYKVWKRGAMSGLTEGILMCVDLEFMDNDDGVNWKNQLKIMPILGYYRGIFSVEGDSGSVVVNKDNKIVGLLNKAGDDGSGFANPIKEVEKVLNITIWYDGMEIAEGGSNIEEDHEFASTVGIPQLFASSIAELSQTERGSSFVNMVYQHYPEVINLLSTNKKFATSWHRNQGPALLRLLREAIEIRTKPMASFIDAKPTYEYILSIFGSLKKFGSTQLVADIENYEFEFLKILELSYVDILKYFQGKLTFENH